MVFTWTSGYGKGFARAIRDQTHGESHLYFICCGYFPHGAVEERRDEILKTKYNFTFECIGGIAPGPESVRFAHAYNWVTVKMMSHRRIQSDFIDSAKARAEIEVSALRKSRPSSW